MGYIWLLINNVQELTPYRFEFKCDTNRTRKCFLSMPRFEPRSPGWMTVALSNSATPPLCIFLYILVYFWGSWPSPPWKIWRNFALPEKVLTNAHDGNSTLIRLVKISFYTAVKCRIIFVWRSCWLVKKDSKR
jgi:hypothetical protein